MLLSIIVPIYNMERHLHSCLNSIQKSIASVHDVEVILIDDGSIDDSLEIANSFAEHYQNKFKVYSKANGGLSDARNYGLEKASGHYIWFIDSDDRIVPSNFQVLYEVLKHQQADYITFPFYLIDENGHRREGYAQEQPAETSIRFNFESIIQYHRYNMVWSRVYSTTLIKGLFFPKGKTHEDIHFNIKALAREPSVVHLTQPQYEYFFDNPQSITNNMNAEKYESMFWVYEDLLDWFKTNIPGKFEEYQKIAKIRMMGAHNSIFDSNLSLFQQIKLSYKFQIRIDKLPQSYCQYHGVLYRKDRISRTLFNKKLFLINSVFRGILSKL